MYLAVGEWRVAGGATAHWIQYLAEPRDELAPLDFIHSVEVERDICEGSRHKSRGAVV